MPYLRSRYRYRRTATRYPSRYSSAALASGRYAAYRSLRGPRKTGFRGRFAKRRNVTVAGNRSRALTTKAAHDFPLYLPRSVMLRQEQKYCQLSEFDAVYAINSTGGPVLMPYPTRGDALNMRLGDRILYNSLVIRGLIRAPVKTINGDIPMSFIDMFVVWDNSPTGTLPSTSTIFTFDGTPTNFQAVGLMQNPDYRDRFSLLYRFRYVLTGNCFVNSGGTDAYSTNGGDRVCVPIDLNLKIGRTTAFATTSSGAGIAQIQRGALYLVMTSNNPGGSPSDNWSYAHFHIRGMFADL